MSIPKYDDRGVIDKLTSGDVGAIDRRDLVTMADTGLSLVGDVNKFVAVPGAGALMDNSTAIGAGLGGLRRYYENEKERHNIAENFKTDNIRQVIRQNRNPALAKSLKKEVDWTDYAGNTAAVIGGATLGGGAGLFIATAFFLPVFWIAAPVISIIGGSIGGGIANKMYNAAFGKEEQNPIAINMQINKIYAENGYVPPEIVFAAMASALPEKSGKRMEDMLAKYTGTRSFIEALSDHNNIPKLAAMMNAADSELRVAFKLPHDPQEPLKTVAEQYAEMINSGNMKPQNLLNRGEGVYVMAAMAKAHDQAVNVPVTPEGKQNQVSKA